MTDKAEPNPQQQGGQPAASAPATGQPQTQQQGGQQSDDRKQVPIAELHREREKRQAEQAEKDNLLNEIQNLKERMTQLQYGEVQPGQAPVNPQSQMNPSMHDPALQQLNQLWQGDNPRAAVQAEIQVALDWFDRMNNAMDIQESQVATKYSDFNNYRNQVRSWVRQMPAAQRAKPGVVELAYHAVRGQNVDDLIKKAQQDMVQRINAGESIQGIEAGSIPGQGGGSQSGLSEQERAAAAVMGISEEEYLKNKG